MPALPLDEAGKYVAGAYVVFLTLILIYVAIIGVEDRADRAADRRAAGAGRDGSERGRRRELGAPRARRLPQDRAACTARAARAARGARRGGDVRADRPRLGARGGGDLDLQPHRALPRHLRRRRGRDGRAHRARPPGGHPPDRAHRLALLVPRPRRGHAPLHRRGGPRLDDRRRGRGAGPGEARLRARPGGGGDRARLQPAVPRRARRRQAGAHRDRGQPLARVGLLRGGGARRGHDRRPVASGACW